MSDLIEFYKDGSNFGAVNSSMVPPVGSKISIKGITHKVTSVTYAFDYSEGRMGERRMRANIDLKECK